MSKVNIPFLHESLILLTAAVTIAPLFKAAKLSPVLGYLVAGALIGPYALGFINDAERVQQVAELGVVFLLFLIGLELPLERLKVMRRLVFGLGGLQVTLTTLLIAGVALACGFDIGQAVVIGGALALSSTALVVQLLSERHELATSHGRASFAVLLCQDLAVVPLLAMTILLGTATAGDADVSILGTLSMALGKGIVAVVGMIVFGRYALRPLYRYFAHFGSDEVFTAATLLLVLGVSLATGQMGLSMALGAFLAGVMIAETEFRHQVEIEIRPFQGLLLGLFFMGVGMSIDFSAVIRNAGTLAALVVGLMVLKGLMIYILARGFSLSNICALRTGLILAQGGEFAFVLLQVAATGGVLPVPVQQLLLITVTFSMALTPLLMAVAAKLSAHRVTDHTAAMQLDAIAEDTHDLRGHVIIAGFGTFGKTVASMLARHEVPYLALDTNARVVSQASQQGLPVYYGSAGRLELLEAIGADRAAAVIVTLDSPAQVRKVLDVAGHNFPGLRVLARAKDLEDADSLMKAGAFAGIPEGYDGSVAMGRAVLSLFTPMHEPVPQA
jgi:monovalent cation:H+ antiporter-2, CPA2 family